MATITFLRHAETELNKSDIFCGTINCSITEEGFKKAKNLRNKFPDKFDAYYCSPLKRTWQTLQAIYPEANFIIDERITEVCYGIWEGVSKNSVNQELRKKLKEGTFTPEGSESYEVVEARINSFLDDISKTYTHNEKILVVTHNGFLRLLARLINIQPINENLEYFTIQY